MFFTAVLSHYDTYDYPEILGHHSEQRICQNTLFGFCQETEDNETLEEPETMEFRKGGFHPRTLHPNFERKLGRLKRKLYRVSKTALKLKQINHVYKRNKTRKSSKYYKRIAMKLAKKVKKLQLIIKRLRKKSAKHVVKHKLKKHIKKYHKKVKNHFKKFRKQHKKHIKKFIKKLKRKQSKRPVDKK
eukprot:gene5974-9973_t